MSSLHQLSFYNMIEDLPKQEYLQTNAPELLEDYHHICSLISMEKLTTNSQQEERQIFRNLHDHHEKYMMITKSAMEKLARDQVSRYQSAERQVGYFKERLENRLRDIEYQNDKHNLPSEINGFPNQNTVCSSVQTCNVYSQVSGTEASPLLLSSHQQSTSSESIKPDVPCLLSRASLLDMHNFEGVFPLRLPLNLVGKIPNTNCIISFEVVVRNDENLILKINHIGNVDCRTFENPVYIHGLLKAWILALKVASRTVTNMGNSTSANIKDEQLCLSMPRSVQEIFQVQYNTANQNPLLPNNQAFSLKDLYTASTLRNEFLFSGDSNTDSTFEFVLPSQWKGIVDN